MHKTSAPLIEELVANLQQCRKERNLSLGLRLHAGLCEAGLDLHTSLGNLLVSLLVEVGGVCYAQQVFDRLALRNQCTWSCLIVEFVNCGKSRQAIALYNSMVRMDTSYPNEFAFVALLKACSDLTDVETGQALFAELARLGLIETNIFISSSLVNMYANCGVLAIAQEVVDKLLIRNIVSWNALISGYADHGCGEEALTCFEILQHDGIPPDAVTMACTLKACGSTRSLSKGVEIHSEIIKKGLVEENFFIGSSLVKMYVTCGALATAREVFDSLPVRNTVVWNALISGYMENGYGEEALDCFKQMQSEGYSVDYVTLVCALKSCDSLGWVDWGQEVHTVVVIEGTEGNLLIGSSLVHMYAKCGSLAQAKNVFDKLKEKDVVAWTSLIAGYADHEDDESAFHFFSSMMSEELSPTAVTYSCILKACDTEAAKCKGHKLHAEATKRGFETEFLVRRSLVDFYSKCNLLVEAQNVVDRPPVGDVACWSTLIVGYIEQGYGSDALALFKHTQEEGVFADVVMLVGALKACGIIGAMNEGKQLHAHLCKRGLERDPFAGSTLVDMYAKCGSFLDAGRVEDKTLASWNALISGYVERGCNDKALHCYKQMQAAGYVQDGITLVFSLKACSKLGATLDGQNIHAEAVRKGLEVELFVSNSLIDMYAKCGFLAEALGLFNACPSQNIVLWTAIIAGHVEHGCTEQALRLFKRMQEKGISPIASSFHYILRACGSINTMCNGEEMYTEIVKKGMLEESVSLGSSLVDMYSKAGFPVKAQDVFNKLPFQDAAAWTALIAGYAEHGPVEEALLCFERMQQEGVAPLLATYVLVLKACSRLRAVDKGQMLHAEIARKGLEREPYIANTLIDLYGKCSLLVEARHMFDKIPLQDVVSWSSLTNNYMETGCEEEVLHSLEQRGLQSADALVGVIKACASLVTIAKGQETHAEMLKKGMEEEHLVVNTLVDMYAKCGSLAEAEYIFGKRLIQDVALWTSLMTGYSQLGMSEIVISSFDKMVEGGVQPDSIAFLSVLSALSHTGQVEEGQMFFEAISKGQDLIPNVEHYTCLVDLIGRAGLIEKAAMLIEEMPIHPGIVVWLTLLGACRKWGNIDLGRGAFGHAVNLNEEESASYVCMANIYVHNAMDVDAS